jgi:hypothetical protein
MVSHHSDASPNMILLFFEGQPELYLVRDSDPLLDAMASLAGTHKVTIISN